MNKIVREHYPVKKLPADLRALVPGARHVTVQVSLEGDDDETVPAPLAANEAVALMRQMQKDAAARGDSVTPKEAIHRIRELRDEWDD